jgi:two-component system chemotaxis response regulator CheB
VSSDPIIVIGASAGGVAAAQELLRELPESFGAAVFLVLHLPSDGVSVLDRILARRSSLPVLRAQDGALIRRNHIYVAVPDHHLTLEPGRMRVLRGPKENRHRPSIDALFRSAADSYGRLATGVILTGFLNDGTNGLIRIKHRGGTAIVQDPEDAESPGMPQSAVERVDVDYILPLRKIAPKLAELVQSGKEPAGETSMPNRAAAPQNGKPSTLTCPDCHGALWELEEGDTLTFRCRVGHRYSADGMFAAQNESVERALWAAARALEESAALSKKLAKRARERNQSAAARMFEERAQNKEEHANVLRDVLEQDDKQFPRQEAPVFPDERSA